MTKLAGLTSWIGQLDERDISISAPDLIGALATSSHSLGKPGCGSNWVQERGEMPVGSPHPIIRPAVLSSAILLDPPGNTAYLAG
jgi:hypothetical protein